MKNMLLTLNEDYKLVSDLKKKKKEMIKEIDNEIYLANNSLTEKLDNDKNIYKFYHSYSTYTKLNEDKDFTCFYLPVNGFYYPIVTHIVKNEEDIEELKNIKDLVYVAQGRLSELTTYDGGHHTWNFPKTEEQKESERLRDLRYGREIDFC